MRKTRCVVLCLFVVCRLPRCRGAKKNLKWHHSHGRNNCRAEFFVQVFPAAVTCIVLSNCSAVYCAAPVRGMLGTLAVCLLRATRSQFFVDRTSAFRRHHGARQGRKMRRDQLKCLVPAVLLIFSCAACLVVSVSAWTIKMGNPILLAQMYLFCFVLIEYFLMFGFGDAIW